MANASFVKQNKLTKHFKVVRITFDSNRSLKLDYKVGLQLNDSLLK